MTEAKFTLAAMLLFGIGMGQGICIGVVLADLNHQWLSRLVRKWLERIFAYCDKDRV